MRTLVLLRGAPGAGKSTFISAHEMGNYTLSPDNIRLMYQSPIIDLEGNESISQKNDGQVWDTLFTILENRMERGEFTIIDATHSRSKLINRYKKLCNKYRYRCHVINFERPLDELLTMNRNREQFKCVPDEVIMKIFYRLEMDKPPSWTNVIEPHEFKNLFDIRFDFTDKYNKIHVFGDIHGCYEPLREFFELNPFNDDDMYIFTGDYFDRGIQNVEVFRFLDSIKHNKNVLLLTGNHEVWLRNYYYDEPIRSAEARKTFKEFEEAGITKAQLGDFYRKLAQVAYFIFGERTYSITHAGIPHIPSQLVATEDYIKGVGRYEDTEIIAKNFVRNTSPNNIMIHAHRNVFNEPMNSYERVYNLCDKVEFGKCLRILTLRQNGDNSEIMIKNDVYAQPQKYVKEHHECYSNATIVGCLRNNKYIRENEMLEGRVSSFNFTNTAFRGRKWDDETVKARGMFVDTKTFDIVARSYDKFFNFNERNETKPRSLQDSLTFPVECSMKYNGFLGILSVYNGEWFIASKSTCEGEYVEMFKKLIAPYLNEQLKTLLTIDKSSMIFEVIDIENDPHIIEYDKSEVILLDIVRNTFTTEMADNTIVEYYANTFGFKCKRNLQTFDTWEILYKFIYEFKQNNDLRYEGVVFKDATNFMFKLKTNYYSFWKQMRNLKTSILKYDGDHTEIRNRLHTMNDFLVYNQMIKIPIEELRHMDMIEIRKRICESGAL